MYTCCKHIYKNKFLICDAQHLHFYIFKNNEVIDSESTFNNNKLIDFFRNECVQLMCYSVSSTENTSYQIQQSTFPIVINTDIAA